MTEYTLFYDMSDAGDIEEGEIPGGSVTTYVNEVWDPTAENYVQWTSTSLADTSGASYPGPGAFGTTSGFHVLAIRVT